MNCTEVRLELSVLAKLLRKEAWQDTAALTNALGGGALAGHLVGPDFAAFSVMWPGACARRTLVWLDGTPPMLVAFDALVTPARKRWTLGGVERVSIEGNTWSGPHLFGRTLLPGAGQVELTAGAGRLEAAAVRPGAEAFFLSVIQFTAGEPAPVEELAAVDLAGVRAGQRLVLFHIDVSSAHSPVYFDAEGAGRFRFLLSGLAAGEWDIWRNGFLERLQEPLRPGAGALYFEGPGGSYFLRRFN